MDDQNRAAREAVAEVLRHINRAWLDGRPDEIGALLHPAVVMVFPGFAGRSEGRDAMVAGFADFCNHARIHEYQETDARVDVLGATAVASFAYEMTYERSAERFRATGRDLWVFTNQEGRWLAAWRTMLDLDEQPA